MEPKDTWEEFSYIFIETGWFDHDRVKTMSAMKRFWERVPQDDLDKVAGVLVFAPSVDVDGQAFPRRPNVDGRWIYFSPTLESRTQSVVDSTVAHEFAHHVLGHADPGSTSHVVPLGVKRHDDVPGEREADALIVRWGFESLSKSIAERSGENSRSLLARIPAPGQNHKK